VWSSAGKLSSRFVWVWSSGNTQTLLSGFLFLDPEKVSLGEIWNFIKGTTGLPQIGHQFTGNIKAHQNGLRLSGPKGLETIYYSILFYFILFYSTLFYSIHLYSILLYSILFYSILVYSILLYSTPFYSIPFHSTPLHSIPLHSTPLYSILLYSKGGRRRLLETGIGGRESVWI
jgi:hypothetical protein